MLVALAPAALSRFLRADGGLHQRRLLMADGSEQFEDRASAYSHPSRYPLAVRLGLAAWSKTLCEGPTLSRARDLDRRYAQVVGAGLGRPEQALASWLQSEIGASPDEAHVPPGEGEAARLDTQCLAWWLAALAAARRPDEAGCVAREIRRRQSPSGLFWAEAEPCLSHFNTQAYAVHSLAMHGASGSLDCAARGAARLVELQGRLGQWWWLYDPTRGTVSDRYPVYTVHQAGMAPMALVAVAAAGGPAHRDALARSLAWIFGENELRTRIILPERLAMHRAIRRASVWSSRLSPALARRGLGRLNALLPGKELNPETRSYTYGWALRALGPLVGDVPLLD